MGRKSVATIGMIGGFLYGEADNKKEYSKAEPEPVVAEASQEETNMISEEICCDGNESVAVEPSKQIP